VSELVLFVCPFVVEENFHKLIVVLELLNQSTVIQLIDKFSVRSETEV
jgi:hypothetical protein